MQQIIQLRLTIKILQPAPQTAHSQPTAIVFYLS